jgi:hypothetical protein
MIECVHHVVDAWAVSLTRHRSRCQRGAAGHEVSDPFHRVRPRASSIREIVAVHPPALNLLAWTIIQLMIVLVLGIGLGLLLGHLIFPMLFG